MPEVVGLVLMSSTVSMRRSVWWFGPPQNCLIVWLHIISLLRCRSRKLKVKLWKGFLLMWWTCFILYIVFCWRYLLCNFIYLWKHRRRWHLTIHSKFVQDKMAGTPAATYLDFQPLWATGLECHCAANPSNSKCNQGRIRWKDVGRM